MHGTMTLAQHRRCPGTGDLCEDTRPDKDFDGAEESAAQLAVAYRAELLEASNWAMKATAALEMVAQEARDWERKLRPVVREYRRDVRELTEETGCELHELDTAIPDMDALSTDLLAAADALGSEYRRSVVSHLRDIAAVHHRMAVEVD